MAFAHGQAFSVTHFYQIGISTQFGDRLFTTEMLFNYCQDYLQELISE
jgi:hypothetical protein